MEIVKDKLYFAEESDWRAAPKLFPTQRLSLDSLYRVKEGGNFTAPSIQSIILHCCEVERRLEQYESVVYTTNDGCDTKSIRSRTCSVLFMAAYAVISLGWSTKYTMQIIAKHIQGSLGNFNDHHGSGNYGLRVDDCLEALEIGVKKHGWFKERTVRRDKRGMEMSWIIPNKVIAMRDPSQLTKKNKGKVDALIKAELKKQSINLIVRLNKDDCEGNMKRGVPYDPSEFTLDGFQHVDIPFKDCGIPNSDQVRKFMKLVSDPTTKVAVHCYAGLGRTGTMIACYLMSDYAFTSRQAIAWLNMCRRGSVMGRQHRFLDEFYEDLCSFRPFGILGKHPVAEIRIRIENEAKATKERLLSNDNREQTDELLTADSVESYERSLIADGHIQHSAANRNKSPECNEDRKSLKYSKPSGCSSGNIVFSKQTASTGNRDHDDVMNSKMKLDEAKLDLGSEYHSCIENYKITSSELLERNTDPDFISTADRDTKTQSFEGYIASNDLMKHGNNNWNTENQNIAETDMRKQSLKDRKHYGGGRTPSEESLRDEIEEKVTDISGHLERRISGLFELISPEVDAKYEIKLNELIKMLS